MAITRDQVREERQKKFGCMLYVMGYGLDSNGKPLTTPIAGRTPEPYFLFLETDRPGSNLTDENPNGIAGAKVIEMPAGGCDILIKDQTGQYLTDNQGDYLRLELSKDYTARAIFDRLIQNPTPDQIQSLNDLKDEDLTFFVASALEQSGFACEFEDPMVTAKRETLEEVLGQKKVASGLADALDQGSTMSQVAIVSQRAIQTQGPSMIEEISRITDFNELQEFVRGSAREGVTSAQFMTFVKISPEILASLTLRQDDQKREKKDGKNSFAVAGAKYSESGRFMTLTQAEQQLRDAFDQACLRTDDRAVYAKIGIVAAYSRLAVLRGLSLPTPEGGGLTRAVEGKQKPL